MKNVFKNILKNEIRLNHIDSRIKDIEVMPFYDVFGSEGEREKDIKTCQKAKKATLNERQVLLENLQLEINKELAHISYEQRKIKDYAI